MTSPAPNPTWDLPIVQLQISEAVQVYGEMHSLRHTQMLQSLGRAQRFESPIEAVFWLWWVTLEALTPERAFPFSLVPQFEVVCDVATYRLDFAIPEHQIAVELDGHEFHEKTKWQVAYRNARDRRLQAAGWIVFHFSGSEFYRSQVDAVASVIDFARNRAKGAAK